MDRWVQIAFGDRGIISCVGNGRSCRRTFCLKFQIFFRPIFCISTFSIFFFQILECEAFQIFCPLLNSWKKKEENLEKSCSIRTALRQQYRLHVPHFVRMYAFAGASSVLLLDSRRLQCNPCQIRRYILRIYII